MGKKLLVREAKAIALARMEDSARTVKDFQAVTKQWDHLDENRERRERYNEISRPNEIMLHWDRVDPNDEKGKLKSSFRAVVYPPIIHHYWRQLIQGDFIDAIYDNANEMWQLVEDCNIAVQLKDTLTDRQKVVLFLSAVRLCTPQQIACYQDKTDRGIRKLLTAALERIRDKIAPIIEKQIEENAPDVTFAKRQFIEWYEEQQKLVLDKNKGD